MSAIEPVTGREYFTQSGERSEVDVKIRLRYDALIADVRPFDRVVHGDHIYDIRAVLLAADRHGDMVLMCVRTG